MAIIGEQSINIGLQNESAGSDSLYTAFNKIQNNFTTLFSCASPYNTYTAGDGISTSTSSNTGVVTIVNTGVLSLIEGTGISLSSSNGNITISSTGGGGNGVGTVTSVGIVPVSTSRITVSNTPIVSSGNISIDLATTGVTAGTYTYPTVTVDGYGRVTNIANATSVGTVTSVAVSGGTGIQITGSPITSSGTINIVNTGVTRLSAGTGISLSGSNGNVTISASVLSGTVTSVGVTSSTLNVSGSPITSAGTITVDLPANITASRLISNVATGTPPLQVNSTTLVANLNVANAAYATTAGTVASIAGANVTGTVANATYAATAGTATSATNATTAVTATSAATAATAGTVTTAAQPNITSVGTLTSLTSSGNVTAPYFLGNVVGNISGNLVVPGSNTAIIFNQSGNAGASDALKFDYSANVLNVIGNVSANYFTGNGSSLSSISGANVTGTVANATSAGTVTTAAQPNITSVGTLTGLTSTGVANLSGTSNVSLGAVANVHISGGTNGYVLSTNGSGNLSWVAQSGGGGGGGANISNGTSNVNIASSGGNVTVSVGGTANVLNISSSSINANATFNVTGTIYGTAIVTSGNITTNNISCANVVSSGNITANGFIANGAGTPTLSSATNLILSAATSVAVQGGGTFRLPSLTSDQIANIIAVNGDMVYNSTVNKFQGYENGAWANLI